MTHFTFQRGALFFASLLLAVSAQAQTSPAAPELNTQPDPIAISADSGPVSVTVDENGAVRVDSTSVSANGEDSTSLDEDAINTDTEEATPNDDAVQHGVSTLPHNLSPWGMFMQADWVVKTVMIGLALASLATWSVFVAKTQELASLMRLQRRTLNTVIESQTLAAANDKLIETMGSNELTKAASHELKLSEGALIDGEGLKERVASRLERIEAANGRAVSRGTSIIASIGSTAPFVGLFGTVWGIMNSFIGISEAQTTNLAVVAPGIAEALLATALGLVAAIPAVVIYNHFARQIAAYKALVGDTSAAVLRLVSRDHSRYVVTAKHD